MLRIYYGRENLDKDKFLFGEIEKRLKEIANCENQNHILLVVPDQFTLQAERNAFACLGVEGLMDLEVLSQSRLGSRVVQETGGGKRLHIDKYGRHMLLSKIIGEQEDSFDAFQGMKKSHAFIEMVNDLITEMKQYNLTAKELTEYLTEMEADSLLYRKLCDVQKIYARYEAALEGNYADTEDSMALFAEKIPESQWIKKSEIWIYGFDSFTPKSLKIIESLMLQSLNVTIVLTDCREKVRDQDLFDLSKDMIRRLEALALKNQFPIELIEIPNHYMIEKKQGKQFFGKGKMEELIHLERELFSYPQRLYAEKLKAISFCTCANFYAEAETAATEITSLVRDYGLRYREIAVICNDMEERGSVIRRVFEQYEIPFFLDHKRTILHNPAIKLVLALLSLIEGNYAFEDVFECIKTGLFFDDDFFNEEIDSLENYAIQYKIRGNRWKSEFRYGKKEWGDEQLANLNHMRSTFHHTIDRFKTAFQESQNVKEQTTVLYHFLSDTLNLPFKLEELQQELIDRMEYEYAEEVAQVWEVVLAMLDQLVELLGSEELSVEDYAKLLHAGFEAVEIGLLPPTADQVLVGTMQRTRTGKIKALLILGANEGVLPSAQNEKALLNDDEKAVLMQKGIEICKDDILRIQEEKLAIYKTLSKPTDYIWMSHTVSDLEGKEMKPSMIFEKLHALFPKVTVEKDIQNRDDVMLRIQRVPSTANYLTEALRDASDGKTLREQWKIVYNWFLQKANEKTETKLPGIISGLQAGILYENRVEKLQRDLVETLYKKDGWKDFLLSPSRLERFGRCPFSHFIQYGLRPAERRIFEIAGREVGDAYHECLMRFSQELTVEGMDITDERSPWMKLTKETCADRISSLMKEIALEYREGVFSQGEEESYRMDRMSQVCIDAAWALVSHVQCGHIKQVYFEAEFGQAKEKPFPPVVVDVQGQKVRIEGKIDRVDVLSGKENSFIKVIDYKSGKERFNLEEAKGGWRLQLMLYLEAAMGGFSKTDTKPAGVFYFEIAEPMVDASGIAPEEYIDSLREKLARTFKLDGVLLDNPNVIESMAGDFTGISDVIPVRKKKDGTFSGTSEGKLLDEAEFESFREQVHHTIEGLCNDLVCGKLDIRPKKTKTTTACEFCKFKGICHFDLAFKGCQYSK
ncbi:PD-(D/E)XK nuclease family protein [Anaerovorax sp. IOR16]|uniref:PD-(D/E)XK nuclease family protein n=1 Tax=Anaerovorax sp. IOR16 TaxID=2773458 RepID=UPI0019CFC1F9|nr:PD-(D/E)XK nuclease family protein [Anaerovorax sp. IOR16]